MITTDPEHLKKGLSFTNYIKGSDCLSVGKQSKCIFASVIKQLCVIHFPLVFWISLHYNDKKFYTYSYVRKI